MPVTPTYPGVYIQEVDSGSRTVSGVATAITAFIGRAPKGPANYPTTVFDYGEFQKTFGGRTRDLPMTYAVEDFFNNGGSQALIVRITAGAPLGTRSHLDLKTGDNPYTLKTKLTGAISGQIFLTVTKTGGPAAAGAQPAAGQPAAQPAAGQPAAGQPAAQPAAGQPAAQPAAGQPAAQPAAPETPVRYTLTFRLGSATSEIILAELKDVPPEAVDMTLKTAAKNVVDVSYGGDPIEPDEMATLLDAVGTAGKAFTGGGPAAAGPAAAFVAGSGAQSLRIVTATPGAWADDLELSIVKRRITDATGTAVDTYTLVADHPAFANPYTHDFTTWDDFKKINGAAETGGLLTVDANTPVPTDAPAKFVGRGIPLTRVPDGFGASAAMRVYGALVLTASSPGEWGNVIGVSFDKRNITDDVAVKYADFGIDDSSDFWNVNVYYPLKKGQTGTSGPAETINAVYLGTLDAPCRIDHKLAVESQYLSARAPVGKISGRDLPLDPTLVGTTDPKDASLRTGVLSGGLDGEALSSDIIVGDENKRSGMYALEQADLFNILVIPPDPLLHGGDDDMVSIYSTAAPYCAKRRAILIADPLDKWGTAAKKSQFERIQPTDFAIGEITSRRSVFTYFPRVKKLDPERGNREMVFSASGMIAGIFAGTDVRRGVWKAPAGIEAGMNGVTNLEHRLSDMQNGVLNQVGVNVLRDFPIIGKVIWGSRTLAGADALSDDYKYLPIRRLTNYVEESLYRGTKFAVFEPNAEPLWATLRLAVGTFMADLARQGAFYDYFVRCDKGTTTQFDIDRGRVNVIIGMAPVKPAEFVILTIQQLAGQTAA
jgi:phage tail sheath protein FI